MVEIKVVEGNENPTGRPEDLRTGFNRKVTVGTCTVQGGLVRLSFFLSRVVTFPFTYFGFVLSNKKSGLSLEVKERR